MAYIGKRYCDKQCRKAGFEPVSENWPSVYWDKDRELLLVVYVDDMKLSGPEHELADAWKRLEGSGDGGIKLDKPKGDVDKNIHTFLGCIHTRVDKEIVVDGKKKIIRCMEYDMTHSMKRSVEKYQRAVAKIAGKEPRVGLAKTPFLPEDTVKAPQRAPYQDGTFVECPSCYRSFSSEDAREKYTFVGGY